MNELFKMTSFLFSLPLFQEKERMLFYLKIDLKARVYLFTISRCVPDTTCWAKMDDRRALCARDCFSLKTDLLWKAPELLNDSSGQDRGSQKADVYAFGFILFEILTRQEAFGAYKLEPKGWFSPTNHLSVRN